MKKPRCNEISSATAVLEDLRTAYGVVARMTAGGELVNVAPVMQVSDPELVAVAARMARVWQPAMLANTGGTRGPRSGRRSVVTPSHSRDQSTSHGSIATIGSGDPI